MISSAEAFLILAVVWKALHDSERGHFSGYGVICPLGRSSASFAKPSIDRTTICTNPQLIQELRIELS
jgi:hypothetical protein